MQAGGLVGSIGAASTIVDIHSAGISSNWSSIKTALLEQVDKQEPSPLPSTYIYSLALTCLTTFEDGLARFLLPFTVQSEKRKKKKQVQKEERKEDSIDSIQPPPDENSGSKKRRGVVNPLSLSDHPIASEIAVAAGMVEQCWPALLATSSTFFNASMDSENFHTLIRSFQKFTQIAGLLELSTPREAFLTTVGKHELPSSKAI